MKIICIGRNYVAHAKELGNEVPGEPLIFLKPDTALVRDNKDFYHPDFSEDIHFECEVVFRVAKEGKNIRPEFARSYINGVGLGIDFTARDLQDKCKEKGHPWTRAKMFDHSAPVSKFFPPEQFPDFSNIDFRLEVNGEVRQQANTSLMMFPLPELLVHITKFITVKQGDLIFTGTPAGVGKVAAGDRLEGYLGAEKVLDFGIR